jgi:hypothetical protein
MGFNITLSLKPVTAEAVKHLAQQTDISARQLLTDMIEAMFDSQMAYIAIPRCDPALFDKIKAALGDILQIAPDSIRHR